jgi:hypothetical protein
VTDAEEGLEQEFNSLDAQREAAEAFILYFLLGRGVVLVNGGCRAGEPSRATGEA